MHAVQFVLTTSQVKQLEVQTEQSAIFASKYPYLHGHYVRVNYLKFEESQLTHSEPDEPSHVRHV